MSGSLGMGGRLGVEKKVVLFGGWGRSNVCLVRVDGVVDSKYLEYQE